MSWARVQPTSGGLGASSNTGTSLSQSFPSAVAVGDLVVVTVVAWCNYAGGDTIAVSDGHNSYNSTTPKLYNYNSTKYYISQIFWSVVTTGGTLNITVSTTGSTAANTNISFGIAEYSFLSGAIVTAESSNASSGTASLVTSGNLAFTPGDLLVAVMSNSFNQTVTAGANFTLGYVQHNASGLPSGDEYWLSATGSPLAATFTVTSSNSWACSAVAFLAQPAFAPWIFCSDDC